MFQSQLNSTLNPLGDYFITQFQPQKIVMQHSKTKAKFFYKQITFTKSSHIFLSQLQERINIQHDNLIQIHYHQWKQNTIGILSEYYQTDLEAQIKRRSRMKQGRKNSHIVPFFTQEQLLNTFSPIVSCINILHQSQLAHGFLKAKNIIVNQNYETKLCDAILLNQQTENRACVLKNAYFPPQFQYNNDISVQGDLWALGIVILEATILQSLQQFYDRKNGKIIVHQIQKKIDDIDQSFTDEYIVAIKLLLSSEKTIRKQGIKVIINGTIPEGILYQKMRPQRKKTIERFYDSESPKKITSNQSKQMFGITLNSTQLQSGKLAYKQEVLNQHNYCQQKKTKIDIIKQKYRSRNTQQMELKKKQIDKINKIIERSNAFVNQLMAKRNDKPSKIPSLGKTSINFNTTTSNFKREFFNENVKRIQRTPGKQKQDRSRDKQRQILLSASLLSQIETKVSSCKQSPKKLYLKRQPQKLKSLSKKK